jgi:hypothetical protein
MTLIFKLTEAKAPGHFFLVLRAAEAALFCGAAKQRHDGLFLVC